MDIVMKALSVRQPWANLIAWGMKSIEVRTWSTDYRGDLLIVSSQKPDIVPAGMALAVVELYDVRDLMRPDLEQACIDPMALDPRHVGWHLRNIRRLVRPVPMSGQLGLWEARVVLEVAKHDPGPTLFDSPRCEAAPLPRVERSEDGGVQREERTGQGSREPSGEE